MNVIKKKSRDDLLLSTVICKNLFNLCHIKAVTKYFFILSYFRYDNKRNEI